MDWTTVALILGGIFAVLFLLWLVIWATFARKVFKQFDDNFNTRRNMNDQTWKSVTRKYR